VVGEPGTDLEKKYIENIILVKNPTYCMQSFIEVKN